MPIYEYACTRCGHALEANQKFSDPPLTTCSSCGEEGLERLVSRSSFALKGAGWYADGYGANAKKGEDANKAKAPAKAAEASAPAAASPGTGDGAASGGGTSAPAASTANKAD